VSVALKEHFLVLTTKRRTLIFTQQLEVEQGERIRRRVEPFVGTSRNCVDSMSAPVGFGDVVKGLEICHWIKKNCFNPINNASILYAGFKEDVLNLEKRLKQFQASFERAIPHIGTDQHQHALLKLEADDLIGDFRATLRECKRILKEHADFDGELATALHNGFWHAFTQPEVTELRNRLQSHHYKIFLFVEPFKFDLLCGIREDTQEILEHLRKEAGITNPIKLPEISQALCATLEKALQRDAPVIIDIASRIPLEEGVDVLAHHFRECTFRSDSRGISPDQRSNLSLLKAHWLYKTLESSEGLEESRPGHLLRRVVEQLGQGIELQYKKRQILFWPDDAFSGLDDTAFAIWPAKEIMKPPVLTEPGPGEEKLVEESLVCPYPGEKQDLSIFRVNDNLLRTVESRSRLDGSVGSQMTERFVHLDEDRFIPVYAVARGEGNKATINLTHGKGAGLAAYDLQSRNSVLRVQQAFTGYEAVSTSISVSCSISYMGKWRVSQDSGVGEVQLWQLPGSLFTAKLPSSPSATISSGGNSTAAGSSYTIASQAFGRFDVRVVSIIDRADEGQMIISQLPKPPLLVVLIEGADATFSIWQLDRKSIFNR
jgi:hypothetical protein